MKKRAISGKELREAAREILDELDKTDRKRNRPDDSRTTGAEERKLSSSADTAVQRKAMEQQDMLAKFSRRKKYRATVETGEPSNNFLMSDSPQKAGKERLLERRPERREARAAADPDGGTDAHGDSVLVTDVRRDELTEAGLPFRLSEVYRRDARRYDGTFERY